VAIFSLTSEGGYSGLGAKFQKALWWAILISDAIEDIRSVLLANARKTGSALALLERQWRFILAALESGDSTRILTAISQSAVLLQSLPMKRPLEQVPVISLVGEIFVRRDSLSRRFLTERLAKSGFAVTCAPIAEWLFYIDLMLSSGRLKRNLSFVEQIEARYRRNFMHHIEQSVQTACRGSGLYWGNPVDIHSIVAAAAPFIPLDLAGECVLTVGSALKNIASHACGVIAIGPFGCMPNRIAEAVLTKAMNRSGKAGITPENKTLQSMLTHMDRLPFLAIESDGMSFPQIIEAKLETFLLGATRLHRSMARHSKKAQNAFFPAISSV
jgi:predicted nucleotide-binding protein (sugar kinase/HSP70/actin superfamily)